MYFFFLCIDFCDIFKCLVDIKVLMVGCKRKIYYVLNCFNVLIEKFLDIFCFYLYFVDIY